MTESVGPTMAPLNVGRGEERWRYFDNSINAVSFGFVATAILISMFLVMAIFERFLRPRPPFSSSSNDHARRRRASSSSVAADLEAQRRHFAPKLDDYPVQKMSIYAKGVSVLMPGHDVPTFIAQPAPAPCPPERILWPPYHHNIPIGGSALSSS